MEFSGPIKSSHTPCSWHPINHIPKFIPSPKSLKLEPSKLVHVMLFSPTCSSFYYLTYVIWDLFIPFCPMGLILHGPPITWTSHICQTVFYKLHSLWQNCSWRICPLFCLFIQFVYSISLLLIPFFFLYICCLFVYVWSIMTEGLCPN